MDNKPFILISNDDGINAAGIKHLWNCTYPYYEVAIVAPHREKSGTGLATSLLRPLHTFKVKWDKDTVAYRVTGTPTDAVKIALSSLLERKPDLVISGINKGSNAGRNVLYSGTVACVIEAALRGILGIAFSCYELSDPDYETAERYIPKIIDYFFKNPPPKGTLINVTFPPKIVKVKGFRMSRQGKSSWFENPDKRLHPEGHYYYWLGGRLPSLDNLKEKDNTDIKLLSEGYITAAPIKVNDLTDREYLEKQKNNFEKLFDSL